jgi:SAM-dependent methyltransferase
MTNVRRYAPAVERNQDVILDVLRRHLGSRRRILEVASGSGEHVLHFARAFPGCDFWPSDPDPTARASIDAWVAHVGLGNIRPAIALDVTAEPWPVASADAVLCINMVHISPWAATIGLLRGAARVLAPGGLLYLYGPYRRAGAHTAPTNETFDRSLRARDPAWGIRDLESVAEQATSAGFSGPHIEAMPANNFSVIFARSD